MSKLMELLNEKRDIECELFGAFDTQCTFIWDNIKLTYEGEKYFKDILECEYKVLPNGNIELLVGDDPNLKLSKLVDEFVLSVAGFCSNSDYERWFEECSNEKNGGYNIISRMELGNDFAYVLGENKEAIKGYRYVTWIQNSRGYDQGCYFEDKKQAYVSLLERSASSVGVSLESYYFEKSAFEDIEAVMNKIPDVTSEKVSVLMKDEHFRAIAYSQFLKSSDSEDLQYRLEEEYNKYIAKEESQEENEAEEQEEIEP